MYCCTGDGDQGKPKVNTGIHTLPLYCAPVPDITTMIAASPERCGHASIKLHISVGSPQASSATTSEESDSDVDDAADTRVDEVSTFIVCYFLVWKVSGNRRCTAREYRYVEFRV